MSELRTRRTRYERDLPGEPVRARAGSRYALVVGINAYSPDVGRLRYAVADAQAIGDRLSKEFDFQVTQLLDKKATAQAIRGVLTHWRTATRPEDDVLLFFAGHGKSPPNAVGRPEGYLIPVDASRDPSTWLLESDLIEQAKALPAQRVFLIFDACYAGAALREDVGIPAGTREDQVLKILVAGTEREPVPDGGAGTHSLFTKALLDGLDGLADTGQNPDGIISASELIAFVRSEITWRSQAREPGSLPQTPVGGALQSTPAGDDFTFTPTKPRLPASILRNLRSNQAEERIAAAEQLKARRGTDTAHLAADELIALVRNTFPPQGPAKMADEHLLGVRKIAVESLGALGLPKGFEVLVSLLDSHEPSELRAAAALALGILAAKTRQATERSVADDRQDAIERLIGTLGQSDRRLRDAAKEGLSCIRDAAPCLTRRLAEHDLAETEVREILDALARLAARHPDASEAWPRLERTAQRLWRRRCLARHRLLPHRLELVRQTIRMALAVAIGLGLSFFVVEVVVHSQYWLLYGSAALSLGALPGALAGGSFVFVPCLALALARRPTPAVRLAGALTAGALMSLWMGAVNALLGVGRGEGGCGPYTWLCQLLPGLIVGIVLCPALVCLPWRTPQAPEGASKRLPLAVARLRANALWLVVVAAATGLAAAVIRIPRPLSLRAFEYHGYEVLWWGVGGAFLGLTSAVGWVLSLPGGWRPAIAWDRVAQHLRHRQKPRGPQGGAGA